LYQICPSSFAYGELGHIGKVRLTQPIESSALIAFGGQLAHKASAYLLELVDQNAIHPTASRELDSIYTDVSPPLPPGISSTHPDSKDIDVDPTVTLLLPDPTIAIPRILNACALPKEAERSLRRAVEQAQFRSEADGDGDMGDE
jgi:hypothetical protein